MTCARRRSIPKAIAAAGAACALAHGTSAPDAAVPDTSPTSREAATATDSTGRVPWRTATPDYAWSFPRDHFAHEGYRSEWWYVTGHLRVAGEVQPRFGFQLTFFQVRLRNEPADSTAPAWDDSRLVMGHAAITDLEEGRHVFSEVLRRAGGLVGGFGTPPDSVLAWSLAPAGTDDRWELAWTGGGFALRMADAVNGIGLALTATPEKPRVFQGPNGYSRKGDGGASQYYSFTRLATTGRVTFGGRTVDVEGLGWMDREFSTSALGPTQIGWDWLALHLADGRDVMVYVLRDSTGAADVMFGTVVDRAGRPAWLSGDDLDVTASGAWTSPETGARYPTRWRLRIPSEALDVVVSPVVANAEDVSTRAGLHYWEGPVTVTGAAGASIGRGYVELTGYGERNRPPL